jgi:hypothetical protein
MYNTNQILILTNINIYVKKKRKMNDKKKNVICNTNLFKLTLN